MGHLSVCYNDEFTARFFRSLMGPRRPVVGYLEAVDFGSLWFLPNGLRLNIFKFIFCPVAGLAILFENYEMIFV